MSPSIQLFSVYYKPFALFPKAPYVTAIQAGAATASQKLDMPGDDTGDNISCRNYLYSELTTAYWIMKNAERNCDAWGLCHYRRYLVEDRYKLFFKKRSRVYLKTSQEILDSILTPALYTLMQKLLSDHDVILPRRDYAMKEKGVIYSIEQAYRLAHIKSDWDTAMEVVREQYPEYDKSIMLFSGHTVMSFNNVMIARWGLWDDYLTWLFSILFEVQNRISLPKQGYQSRVLGFLAERLHNLFIFHNGLKPAYLTMALFDKQI